MDVTNGSFSHAALRPGTFVILGTFRRRRQPDAQYHFQRTTGTDELGHRYLRWREHRASLPDHARQLRDQAERDGPDPRRSWRRRRSPASRSSSPRATACDYSRSALVPGGPPAAASRGARRAARLHERRSVPRKVSRQEVRAVTKIFEDGGGVAAYALRASRTTRRETSADPRCRPLPTRTPTSVKIVEAHLRATAVTGQEAARGGSEGAAPRRANWLNVAALAERSAPRSAGSSRRRSRPRLRDKLPPIWTCRGLRAPDAVRLMVRSGDGRAARRRSR